MSVDEPTKIPSGDELRAIKARLVEDERVRLKLPNNREGRRKAEKYVRRNIQAMKRRQEQAAREAAEEKARSEHLARARQDVSDRFLNDVKLMRVDHDQAERVSRAMLGMVASAKRAGRTALQRQQVWLDLRKAGVEPDEAAVDRVMALSAAVNDHPAGSGGA